MANKFSGYLIALGFAPFLLGVGTCKPKVEDNSAVALVSYQATMVFGGCSRPMAMGYDVCQLRLGQELPKLNLVFMNPGEWAVSDCAGNFYKSGSAEKPGAVEVDLSGLQAQANKYKVCWLKIETTERYADRNDPSQLRTIPLAGGFIVEFLAEGYNPSLPDDTAAWCYELRRSTKGRTTVKACR